MHRNLFRDDGLFQHARPAGGQRGGAGEVAALEQRMGGDFKIFGKAAQGIGGRLVLLHRNHEQLQQACLAVEYLHACHVHRVVAVVLRGDVHHGIGQHRAVVLVQ